MWGKPKEGEVGKERKKRRTKKGEGRWKGRKKWEDEEKEGYEASEQ